MGTGWLGWTEQQTLDTSIPAIELAYDGRIEMLKMCFGSGEDAKPKPSGPPAGKDVFAVLRRAAAPAPK